MAYNVSCCYIMPLHNFFTFYGWNITLIEGTDDWWQVTTVYLYQLPLKSRLNFSTHVSSRLTFQLLFSILISHFGKIHVQPVKLCFRVFSERCCCNFVAVTPLIKLETFFRLPEHCDIYIFRKGKCPKLTSSQCVHACSKPA